MAPSGVTHGASCMQAVELCRMLAELEGVEDAVPSSRLQSAASSPSIQVQRPSRWMGTDELIGMSGWGAHGLIE